MNVPQSVRGFEVLAFAPVPKEERHKHGYTVVATGSWEQVAAYAVVIERGAEFRVHDEDGSRIEPDTYWLFELDDAGEVVEDTPRQSLDKAVALRPDLDWTIIR